MTKLKIVLASLLMGASFTTLADESEYNVDTRVLTIPTVKIGNSFVYDARLHLNDAGSFDLIGFSENPLVSVGVVDAVCTPNHVTLDKLDLLKNGLTVEQVNNIMGCEGTLQSAGSGLTSIWWQGGGRSIKPVMAVSFQNGALIRSQYIP